MGFSVTRNYSGRCYYGQRLAQIEFLKVEIFFHLFLGIGNGFPIGAVVTTPEIAKSLNTALHFNTFGGNPMASAVGIAVLEVFVVNFKYVQSCFISYDSIYPGH